jgi:predicted tellurium resistance membrane protein TerC
MLNWIADPQAWIALATLTALEIVLGIDNIVFISIIVSKLPAAQRNKARVLGLGLAMFTRIALLFSLVWIMRLTAPLFTVLAQAISGRDIILIGGGLFLIAKSSLEIHNSLEGTGEHEAKPKSFGFAATLVQIALVDIIFSLDSVITAVGLVQELEIMVLAIVVAVFIMMWASGPVSAFVDRHPTVKMLALAFLVMIGVALIAEGLDLHIPRGYIYFAMAFSVTVEMLNLRLRGRGREPVVLHRRTIEEEE